MGNYNTGRNTLKTAKCWFVEYSMCWLEVANIPKLKWSDKVQKNDSNLRAWKGSNLIELSQNTKTAAKLQLLPYIIWISLDIFTTHNSSQSVID